MDPLNVPALNKPAQTNDDQGWVFLPGTFLHYTNHHLSENRFEMCLEKCETESVSLRWSTPRSLLLNLANSGSKQARILLQLMWKEGTQSSPLLQHFIEVEGEFALSLNQVRVIVNGTVWPTVEWMWTKKSVTVFGLQSSNVYVVQLVIAEYRSLPFTFMTSAETAGMADINFQGLLFI